MFPLKIIRAAGTTSAEIENETKREKEKKKRRRSEKKKNDGIVKMKYERAPYVRSVYTYISMAALSGRSD